jgi:hypothetical protein
MSRSTTGINNTGSKIAAGINHTGGKFATNFTSVVDTGGKFAPGFNDTGGKSTTLVANNGTNYQTADNLEWTCIYMLTLLPKGRVSDPH